MFQLRRSEVFLRLPQVGGDQRTTKIDPRDLGICAITMGKSIVKSSVVKKRAVLNDQSVTFFARYLPSGKLT